MDDGIEPRRSHDELMGLVVARGESIKARRRRMVSLAGGGMVLVMALVAGLLTASTRINETRVSAEGARPKTTTTVAVGSGPAGTSALEGGLLYPLSPITTPTVVAALTPAAPPTTAAPNTPAPSAPVAIAPAPITPVPAPAPTTTVPKPAALVPCSRDQLVVSAATGQAVYFQGQKVTLVSTIRNQSAHACTYNGYTFSSVFNDSTGKAVTLTSAVHADTFRDEPLSPGETLTQSREWDRRVCTYGEGSESCTDAFPGTYTGAVRWDLPGGPYEATATFGLTTLPVPVPAS